MNNQTVQLTSDEQKRYRLIIEIYKKIQEELFALRKEIKRLEMQVEEKEDKKKIKDTLYKIIHTID